MDYDEDDDVSYGRELIIVSPANAAAAGYSSFPPGMGFAAGFYGYGSGPAGGPSGGPLPYGGGLASPNAPPVSPAPSAPSLLLRLHRRCDI